ncbi:MAG: S1-like domain-containing RNA-binding protein [Muribaculaceae bacterium]|nr:S1-like domain-containing RNA-binding protein [Muribaculaceae bacterium]
MVEIGKYNKLPILKFVDFGAYLDAGNGIEILLPLRYVDDNMSIGDEVDVFIYNDSEDRLVAVTDTPIGVVGEFAFLKVSQVNSIGAFLDWGLPKDLLVPFREQKVRMEKGRYYLVYIYLDDNTKRIVASAKLDKFLDNTIAKYEIGETVDIIINKRTDLGYKVIINNLHWGMIYHNEIFTDINIGEHHTAHVKSVRDDGKIDLVLGAKCKERTNSLSDSLLEYMCERDNFMPFNDSSSPEDIRNTFNCSKKDFKKAIGHLLKKDKIAITDNGTIIK